MSATPIVATGDLTPDLVEKIKDQAEAWLGAPGQRDWEDWLARVEGALDLDLPTQMDDPVIKKVQRIARDAWNEANQ